MSKTTCSSHDTLAPLSATDLPLVIHHGELHAHWAEAARAKGFDLIARVRDRLHVALRCQTCGWVHVTRHSVVMNAQPLCPHCMETRWRETALVAGLTWLGRDPDHRHYGRYLLPCDHTARRQFTFVERVASGAVSARCETCLVHREGEEALRFGWARLSRDPTGNPSYRLYRHSCGHTQRIAVANMRWGQCDCAGCGQSWTAKPSYIYLLDIRHSGTGRHYLKVGYSSHPVKRHKHQLGLPKDAQVEVLRVVAMPTGHAACAMEKAAHAELRRLYPEALVPHREFSDLMNVVSEIYRPESLFMLQATLDRIEAEIIDADRTRRPDTLSAPPKAAAGNNPEAPLGAPETPPPGASATPTPASQSHRKPRPATVPRDRHPILRRHWGLTG
ncbi:GIY-YIG nuclease family protein [Paracoccus sp. J55]|uniref:GIY-YIG nuclease family protein n=1 Tax=Paracoccus sp. J55 TaxID=935849 RepID=UPI0009FE2B83|nr:GIY-YIG nuclease family protein [Paracoccus sp. J55]